MSGFRKILLSASLVAMPQIALAATVNIKSGQVFVDRGQGYVQITQPTQVSAGDTVMTMVGGTGEIVYDDGCRQAVEVGSVIVVAQAPPCLANTTTGPDYTLIVGGAAVAAGIGAAIALSGGDDEPASK